MQYLSIALVLLAFTACSTQTISDESPASAQYREGEELLKDKQYLEALERFRILKTRYPYSNYATKATLKIADVYFDQGAFIEAAAAYRIFTDLYPKNEAAAYAYFQQGLSSYSLVPDVPDRDLSDAFSAINAFTTLKKRFPNSKHIDDANKMLLDLRKRLAKKEEEIGNFYFTREHYRAAAERLRRLLDRYSEVEMSSRSLYRLAYSFQKIGELEKAQDTVALLQQTYPRSRYSKMAKSILQEIKKEQE